MPLAQAWWQADKTAVSDAFGGRDGIEYLGRLAASWDQVENTDAWRDLAWFCRDKQEELTRAWMVKEPGAEANAEVVRLLDLLQRMPDFARRRHMEALNDRKDRATWREYREEAHSRVRMGA